MSRGRYCDLEVLPVVGDLLVPEIRERERSINRRHVYTKQAISSINRRHVYTKQTASNTYASESSGRTLTVSMPGVPAIIREVYQSPACIYKSRQHYTYSLSVAKARARVAPATICPYLQCTVVTARGAGTGLQDSTKINQEINEILTKSIKTSMENRACWLIRCGDAAVPRIAK